MPAFNTKKKKNLPVLCHRTSVQVLLTQRFYKKMQSCGLASPQANVGRHLCEDLGLCLIASHHQLQHKDSEPWRNHNYLWIINLQNFHLTFMRGSPDCYHVRLIFVILHHHHFEAKMSLLIFWVYCFIVVVTAVKIPKINIGYYEILTA